MRRGYSQSKPKKLPFTQSLLRHPDFRLRMAVASFVVLMVGGTLGYHVFEHWNYLDSLFMTVITVSGVGYGEIHDLDKTGIVFSIVLIVVGVGMVGWAIVTMFEALMSEQGIRNMEKRRTKRLINAMNHHFIICGFGRIGRSIIEGLSHNDYSFVIVEPDAARAEELRLEGIPYVQGDAASDEVLQQAGIAKAKALITVTPSDAINTYIILSARWLRPDLMIVARAISPDSAPKLYRAGASKVISPHTLGGWWMTATAINPAATDFIEGLRLAESSKTGIYEFTAGANISGRNVASMAFKHKTGALVVAIRRGDEFIANPPDKFVLQQGDGIIAIGSVKEFELMAKVVDPENPIEVEPTVKPVELTQKSRG